MGENGLVTFAGCSGRPRRAPATKKLSRDSECRPEARCVRGGGPPVEELVHDEDGRLAGSAPNISTREGCCSRPMSFMPSSSRRCERFPLEWSSRYTRAWWCRSAEAQAKAEPAAPPPAHAPRHVPPYARRRHSWCERGAIVVSHGEARAHGVDVGDARAGGFCYQHWADEPLDAEPVTVGFRLLDWAHRSRVFVIVAEALFS